MPDIHFPGIIVRPLIVAQTPTRYKIFQQDIRTFNRSMHENNMSLRGIKIFLRNSKKIGLSYQGFEYLIIFFNHPCSLLLCIEMHQTILTLEIPPVDHKIRFKI